MRADALEIAMLEGFENQALQSLSALTDGELDAAATALACAQWRSDRQARAAWHAYQLIGDVLRSDELAADAAHDAHFLEALRQRLAAEPVVLAPPAATLPTAAELARRPRWPRRSLAAVAAGLVVAAGGFVALREQAPADAARLAEATGDRALTPALPGSGAAVADAFGEPQTLLADDALVRDARLQRYFAAHTQFGGSSALGAPAGFLRAAAMQTPDR